MKGQEQLFPSRRAVTDIIGRRERDISTIRSMPTASAKKIARLLGVTTGYVEKLILQMEREPSLRIQRQEELPF